MAELGTVVALIKSMSGADPAVIEEAVQDWLAAHPEATTTVQDGSITEAKLAQDVLADLGEIDELKEAIVPLVHEVEIAPKGVGSDATDVDLDVADEDGNVLLRLSDGHIQTKNFSSKTMPKVQPTNEDGIDIDITDTNGNVLVRFASGHIQTKHFNSANQVPSDTNPLACIKDNPDHICAFLHVGCIGDSIASGAASSNEKGYVELHDIYEHSWGQYLARATGNTYYNFSAGGLTAKSWLESTYATQCFDGDHNCEAYIIGLGENDYTQSITIGSSADIDLSDYTQNADTYYGNYGKIIQKVQELQPTAKIFVVTNPKSHIEDAGYNTAVRNMANIFSNVYVLDLYTYGDILASNSFLRKSERNAHYNAIGYKYISKVIATYIDWIIEQNQEDFNTIELIGTEWSILNN